MCGRFGEDCSARTVRTLSANLNNDISLYDDFARGIDRSQIFNQWSPLTMILMRDPHQRAVLAQVRGDLAQGRYTGYNNYADPHTIAQFIKDMTGYVTHGRHGSNYADAFLGSYNEQWWAIPNGNGTATAYFEVTNTTDLNSLFHPGKLTFGLIKSVDWAPPVASSSGSDLAGPAHGDVLCAQ